MSRAECERWMIANIYMGYGPEHRLNAHVTPKEAWSLAHVYMNSEVEMAKDSARWSGRWDVLKLLVVGFLVYRAVISFL